MIGEGKKKHYVPIKDFSTFMYDNALHGARKHFVVIVYRLKSKRNTKEMSQCHINDCFKINGKHTFKMPKKDEYVKFKKFERKIKSPFMIYADFESILAP